MSFFLSKSQNSSPLSSLHDQLVFFLSVVFKSFELFLKIACDLSSQSLTGRVGASSSTNFFNSFCWFLFFAVALLLSQTVWLG